MKAVAFLGPLSAGKFARIVVSSACNHGRVWNRLWAQPWAASVGMNSSSIRVPPGALRQKWSWGADCLNIRNQRTLETARLAYKGPQNYS